jgi:hypothetical protein
MNSVMRRREWSPSRGEGRWQSRAFLPASCYAGVDNPSEANIVGGDGLPMPPLRTDDWPLQSPGQRYGL